MALAMWVVLSEEKGCVYFLVDSCQLFALAVLAVCLLSISFPCLFLLLFLTRDGQDYRGSEDDCRASDIIGMWRYINTAYQCTVETQVPHYSVKINQTRFYYRCLCNTY